MTGDTQYLAAPVSADSTAPTPTAVLFALAAAAHGAEPIRRDVLVARLAADEAAVLDTLERLVHLGLVAAKADGYALAVDPEQLAALDADAVEVLVVDGDPPGADDGAVTVDRSS